MNKHGIRIKYVNKSHFNGASITEYKKGIKVHTTSYIEKIHAKIGYNLRIMKVSSQIFTELKLEEIG